MRGDFITTTIIAEKYLEFSRWHVARMCAQGVFKSAHKRGMGPTSAWRVLRSEVIAHLYNRHAVFIPKQSTPKT